MAQVLRIGLIGAGMFGGDVHAHAYADLQRAGISPCLGRLGLDDLARDLAPIQFELSAIATRTERSALAASRRFQEMTGHAPRCYWGEQPWTALLLSHPNLDVVAVATPDHLHTPVVLAALNGGTHVLCEKPLCLDVAEADVIIELAKARKRIVALDMHKRYDSDHLRIRQEIAKTLGEPLYGMAYLEEPLEVSASTFKWAQNSDPFSYVGSHWVDLIHHYFHSKPVSLTAVGQKRLLVGHGIDAYDAVQVRVDYQNGMSISFHNNWITPPEFEGPVNQGHELVGTQGKVESDQQYRGLRWWAGGKSHTANSHFTRNVPRPDGSSVSVGYGIDSIIAGLVAVCRMKWLGAEIKELSPTYPNLEDARIVVGIIHAARVVRDLNYRYMGCGKGAASVSARFGDDGITIIDPNQQAQDRVVTKLYSKPL